MARVRSSIVLALTIWVTTCTGIAFCQQLTVQVSSPSACMMDLGNGVVMWEKQARERRAPASLTKIATALTVLERFHANPEERIAAQPEALQISSAADRATTRPYGLATDGSSIDLRPGEEMTVEALLEGLLVRSGNDAANVLAMHCGKGSISRFVDEMNDYLRELGCHDTRFQNPHGLDAPNHFSSAADLALISSRAVQHPLIRSIVAKRQFSRPKTQFRESQVLATTNQLLRPGKDDFDRRARGLKTGSTQAAGSCLIALADLGQRQVMTVVLGGHGRQRYLDTRKLFDAADAEKKVLRSWAARGPVGRPRTVHGGASYLQPVLHDALEQWVFPSAEEPVRLELRLHDPIRPPIAKGQLIGSLVAMTKRGQELTRQPVVAAEAVHPTWTYRISQLWKHWGRWGDFAVLASLFLGMASWLGVLLTPRDETTC